LLWGTCCVEGEDGVVVAARGAMGVIVGTGASDVDLVVGSGAHQYSWNFERRLLGLKMDVSNGKRDKSVAIRN